MILEPQNMLKNCKRSDFFWILPEITEFLWSGTEGPRCKIQGSE